MKTNKILVALALPALFAACTAEEIVSQADNNVSLENRALLGDLTAKIENPLESRVSWNEEGLKWGEWEADDVFSAALTDPAGDFKAGHSLLTNYVFKVNAEGEWTTTSQMVEGLYSFYSYKGIEVKNDRKPVAFDIRNQKADLDEPTKVLDDHQLFFSPLYKIEAANTTAENNIDLPLEFYPYHSAGMFYIKNNTGQDLKISQIILKGKFGAKGSIMPEKIDAKNFRYEVRSWKGVSESEYKLLPKTARTDDAAAVEYKASEIKEMWEASVLDDAAEVEQIVLDCGKWTLEDGDEVQAYMNIPAGKQTTLEVEINVIDEEGNAKTIYVNKNGADYDSNDDTDGIESTDINKLSFKRGTATAIFGKNNGAPKAVVVKEENLCKAKGTYVDNQTDLIKLINEGRGTIVVYNAEGLKINSAVAEALAANTACDLEFNNPIEIEDFTETVELINVKFNKKATVKAEYKADGTTATERGTTVVLGEGVIVTAEGIEVEKYTTATLAGGEYASVTNKGTMTLYATDAKVTAITNEGTLTVDNGSAPAEEAEAASRTTAAGPYAPEITTIGTVAIVGMDPVVNFNGGSLSYTADTNTNGNIAMDVTNIVAGTGANLTLTIGADVTLKKAFTFAQAYTAKNGDVAAKYLTVNMNGNWVLGAENNQSAVGKLVNAGKISESAESNLVIIGESSNSGEISLSWFDVMADAKLTNNGLINTSKSASNDGTIINNAGAYLNLSSTRIVGGGNGFDNAATGTATGRIENYGALEFTTEIVKASQEIYCVLNNKTIADVEALNVDRYMYNTIQITGTFTASRDFGAVTEGSDDILTKMAKIKNIEFNGATLDMNSATTNINIAFNELRIMGNVTMKGFTSAASKLVVWGKTGNASKIVMAKSSSLTVQNMTIMPATGDNLTVEAPTLVAADKVTNATNGDYWAAAAKVYNKGVIDLTTAPTVFTTKSATAATNNLYWEGTAASLLQ